MTTVKEFLKNILHNCTEDVLECFSVIIKNNEPCAETKLYNGCSDHKILESEKIVGAIPSFGG